MREERKKERKKKKEKKKERMKRREEREKKTEAEGFQRVLSAHERKAISDKLKVGKERVRLKETETGTQISYTRLVL